MQQFQIRKSEQSATRIVDVADTMVSPGQGEIVVQIERFGFSANNVTYAVAGETLNYWKFFASAEDADDEWGVLPVWGFAQVVQSNATGIEVGERLFGYFPPATQLKMKPSGIADTHIFDASEHRLELPKGYNIYRRVQAEPPSTPQADNLRMLLYPLYVTSFCIWDQLVEFEWYGAEQVIIISASSKTSIGLGYALQQDDKAPTSVGLTSSGNKSFVEKIKTYDTAMSYSDISNELKNLPSVIVDMAGNGELLGDLHEFLGDNMRQTISVGLTHWDTQRRDSRVIGDRTAFFFAPSRIQQRMKDWGADQFNAKSSGFVMHAASQSAKWLDMQTYEKLEDLTDIYAEVRAGQTKPEAGILFEL